MLGKPAPEIRLFQRVGRKLWVTATGSGSNQTRRARFPRVVKNERPHCQVLVEKLSGALLVRQDSSDQARQMDDHVGRMFAEESDNLGFARQVVVLMANNERTRGAFLAKRFHHMASEK